jgi:hypothetical protein
MSLATPTTQQVSATIVAQLEASLSQTLPILTSPLLPRAFLRALAKVLAGALILIYKRAGLSWLQMFVQYASWHEFEVNGRKIRPLVEWGRMLGVGDPIDAVRAELTVEIGVLRQGGTVPAGQQLIKPTTGVLYTTLAPVVLDAPTKQVVIRAVDAPSGDEGAGVAGNLNEGEKLELAQTLGNVARQVTVISLDVAGADAETEANYRARVLRRKQRPPQGGAYADYRLWGETVPGVANVYSYTGQPGEVNVYVECMPHLDADGIPTRPMLDAVEAAITADNNGRATRLPVNATVHARPIRRRAFELVVTGLVAPDIAAMQDLLSDAVDEYLRTREPFIVGLSVLPRRDQVTQPALGGVVHDVVSSVGGSISRVELRRDTQSIERYLLADGEKAKLAPGGLLFE